MSHSNSSVSKNRKHFIFAVLVVILLAVILLFTLSKINLLPVQASLQAIPIDQMFSIEFKLIAFFFALVIGFLVYSIVVFRRRKGDTGDGDYITGNTRLEVTWTLVPLGIVLGLSYLGAQALAATQRTDPNAMIVKVTASQWNWRFDYPDSGITSNELVLPVNQQVQLQMISLDVIHSFWVPEFRVKQDILPGGPSMVRDLTITPDLVGSYKVRCAKLCGLNHAYMMADVRVVSAEDYTTWVQQQTGAATNDPAALGKKYATQFGCLGCHSTDGTKKVGPSWQGLSGSQVTLADGSSVTAEDDYLVESIKAPSARVVKGYADIMPNLSNGMSAEQLNAIVAFIKSLK